MNPLLTTIANGTVQIWAAALCLVAATSVDAPASCTNKSRDAHLDSRTLKDIGVEPGSITWL
jgi:hypothetical protein